MASLVRVIEDHASRHADNLACVIGADRRSYHFQVVAAALGTQNPEQNLFQQIPDVDAIENIRANQDPNWIAFVSIGVLNDVNSM